MVDVRLMNQTRKVKVIKYGDKVVYGLTQRDNSIIEFIFDLTYQDPPQINDRVVIENKGEGWKMVYHSLTGEEHAYNS